MDITDSFNTERFFLSEVLPLAVEAGQLIMSLVGDGPMEVERKPDNSPVTQADRMANELILERLAPTRIPVISEEQAVPDWQVRRVWTCCWLVDPLDGTSDFIKGSGEFTVNIALVEHGRPQMGVIYAPVSGKLYYSTGYGKVCRTVCLPNQGKDGVIRAIGASQHLPVSLPGNLFRVVASRSHFNHETEAFIEDLRKKYPNLELVQVGGSLKFCLLAEGGAEFYPRLGTMMEWDTAAGHAIAEAAGCYVISIPDRSPLLYNKPSPVQPWFAVARNKMAMSEILV